MLPRLLLLTFTLGAASTAAFAQATPDVAPSSGGRPSFGGFFVTLDGGRQNVIAGAKHQEVDVLHQVNASAVTVGVGVRGEFPSGTVVGVELGGGPLRSELARNEPTLGIHVQYEGSRQRYLGGQLGQVVGKSHRTLIYAYAYEMTRAFSVTIEAPSAGSSTFPVVYQEDEQGLLRYGVGVESAVRSWLSMRIAAGTSRADFGDQVTNIRVGRPLEVSLGLVGRFRWRSTPVAPVRHGTAGARR